MNARERLTAWSTIVRTDLELVRREPTFVLTMVIVPLIVMVFLKSAFRTTLVSDGFPRATGAEQAVPGAVIPFSMAMVANIAFNIFREGAWRTWPRLLITPLSTAEILSAKLAVPIAILIAQVAFLFTTGFVVLDLRLERAWTELALICGAYVFCLAALGVLLLAVCKSMMQVTAIANLGSGLLAGLGGALTPISTLPPGVRNLSPATPSYWAMKGMRTVILGGPQRDLTESVMVLLAIAVGALVISAIRLRPRDRQFGLR